MHRPVITLCVVLLFAARVHGEPTCQGALCDRDYYGEPRTPRYFGDDRGTDYTGRPGYDAPPGGDRPMWRDGGAGPYHEYKDRHDPISPGQRGTGASSHAPLR